MTSKNKSLIKRGRRIKLPLSPVEEGVSLPGDLDDLNPEKAQRIIEGERLQKERIRHAIEDGSKIHKKVSRLVEDEVSKFKEIVDDIPATPEEKTAIEESFRRAAKRGF